MEAAREDKYVTELRKAQNEARSLPTEYANRISTLEFVGAVKTPRGNYYFYKDKDNGEYYYDSDSSRNIRKEMKRNKLKMYAKKIAHP